VAKILIVGQAAGHFSERGLVGTRAGHEVHWFDDGPAPAPAGVASLSHPPRAPRGLVGTVRAAALRRTLRRLRPDLVHVHFAYQGLAALALADHPRLVLTTMGGDVMIEQGQVRSRRRQLLLRLLLCRARAITCQAPGVEQAVLRWGDYRHKIHRVRWGVDRGRFRPGLETADLRARHGLAPDELVLFCCRLCQPLYNKDLALRAFARARERGLRARLLVSELYAEPGYRARLDRLVGELGLGEAVRFVGAIPHADMPRYFNLADVVLSLPSSDGLPQSVLEAMACGSYPILGRLALPVYAELVEGPEHGRLVALDDPGELSEALLELAEDPALRARAASAGREHVSRLADWEDQAARMNAIYQRVLEG